MSREMSLDEYVAFDAAVSPNSCIAATSLRMRWQRRRSSGSTRSIRGSTPWSGRLAALRSRYAVDQG